MITIATTPDRDDELSDELEKIELEGDPLFAFDEAEFSAQIPNTPKNRAAAAKLESDFEIWIA